MLEMDEEAQLAAAVHHQTHSISWSSKRSFVFHTLDRDLPAHRNSLVSFVLISPIFSHLECLNRQPESFSSI
jgi:hypothetical protein